MTYQRRALPLQATPDEIERLIYYMSDVAELAETDFAKGFAHSIMHDLVSDLITLDPDQGGDFQPFE